MSNSESDAGLTNWNHNISECCPKPNDDSSQVCTEPQNVCLQNISNFTVYTEWDSHICARLWYWQNLVKSMGRSLQVQTVNYLSILSLESSMDAQNNWFMHTIKVFVLQKFTVVVFKYFLKPENVNEKCHWTWDIFQSCSSSQKIKF